MSDATSPVTVNLRIPGGWKHPGEVMERLPAGYKLTPKELILPDSTAIEWGAFPPDGEFAGIFRSSCRRPATRDELKAVDRYAVNFLLSGPGGSLESARAMMRAGAALIQAGGAGVFVDNGLLSHGGRHWTELAEDGSPDAVSFAFVAVIRGSSEISTVGMHVLGLRDVVMKLADAADDGYDIVEVLRYLASGDKPVDDGHVIADLNGPRFRVIAAESEKHPEDSPIHNPFGRFRLVSMRDIAESN